MSTERRVYKRQRDEGSRSSTRTPGANPPAENSSRRSKDRSEPLAKKSNYRRGGEDRNRTSSSTRNSLDLGAESEKKIRQLNLAPLPDGNAFHFHTREKDRYVKNMHLLIVTARAEINDLKSQINELNTRLESHSFSSCPNCKHKFCTTENRVMPKHLRILRGTNRIELHFESTKLLDEWLLLTSYDRDNDSMPVLYAKESRNSAIKTFSSTGSSLCAAEI